eukprot:6207378-Pleurochrysis_carterae.AAC.3
MGPVCESSKSSLRSEGTACVKTERVTVLRGLFDSNEGVELASPPIATASVHTSPLFAARCVLAHGTTCIRGLVQCAEDGGSALVDFLLIELRGAAPHKRHHLHGDLGGDVGVSVAVAAHPRGDLDDGGVVRHGRLADAREGAVEPAVVQRHGVPERLLHHEHAVARLALGRRLRAAHRRRAPARELLLADQALDVGDLTYKPQTAGRGEGLVSPLTEILHDALVLAHDGAALRLGRVGGEHELDLLRGNGLADGLARHALGEQHVEALAERLHRAALHLRAMVLAQAGLRQHVEARAASRGGRGQASGWVALCAFVGCFLPERAPRAPLPSRTVKTCTPGFKRAFKLERLIEEGFIRMTDPPQSAAKHTERLKLVFMQLPSDELRCRVGASTRGCPELLCQHQRCKQGSS